MVKRELKAYSDSRLATRMVKYIELANSIKLQCEYYDGVECPEGEKTEIQESFARLKKALREDAYYLGFSENDNRKSEVYMKLFKPSILCASARGMDVPDCGQPDRKMAEAAQRAIDGFTRLFSYDEWVFLSEQK